jgi:molybdopterin converting factor small subunit
VTDVTLKFTGIVRRRMGRRDRLEFSFEGETLGDLLEALFVQYDLQDLILDDDRNVIPWSRVAVNGRFSYLVGDMDTPIKDGDLIALIRHYAIAF